MSGKVKRYILLIGLVVLAVVVVHRLIPLVQSLEVPKEEIALKAKKLVKYRELLQQSQGLDTQYSKLRKEIARLEKGLLTGKTGSLAAVHIQKAIEKITERSGVEIKKVRVLKPQPLKDTAYVRVAVEFRISCTMEELKEMLYAIRNEPKYLKVTRVRISGYNRGFRKKKVSQKITCALTVEGLMKKA